MDEEKVIQEEVTTPIEEPVQKTEKSGDNSINEDYNELKEQITSQTKIIEEQSELITQLKDFLNEQFKLSNVISEPLNEIEQYLSSENSLTNRILKSYNKKES